MDGRLIGAAILFLFEQGLQMSGYTNPLLTLLFWGSAAMLFLLWLLDFAQRRLWLETPYQRKFMGPLVLGFIGLAFLVGAGVWYYTKSGRIAPYPVVAGRFVYPTHPALLLVNQSDVVARDIKYAPALWNLDTLPTSHSGLPIPAGTFDWIPARKAGGPMNLFETPNVAPLIAAGNRIFGTVAVSCPECTRGYTYWVYIVWGQGGWHSEIKDKTDGAVLVPRGITNEQLKSVLIRQMESIPESERITIEDWK